LFSYLIENAANIDSETVAPLLLSEGYRGIHTYRS